MLPSLLSSETSGRSAVSVPPPPHFRPLRGKARNVWIEKVGWSRVRGDTAAREAGLRYEAKVQRELSLRYPDYWASPQIHFTDDSGSRLIIPDGLISRPSRVFIFEVKSQHMPEAWWQLETLYRPVLQVRRPLCPITCIEICRSYDPAMPFPSDFSIHASVEEILSSDSAVANLAVVPWKL